MRWTPAALLGSLLLVAPAPGAGAVLAAARSGDVVHLLLPDAGLPSLGSRVERFDLATESWLPAISFDALASDLVAQPDALYVAFQNGVARYSPDGATLVWLTPSSESPSSAVVAGDYLFTTGRSIDVLDRQTGALLHSAVLGERTGGLSAASGSQRLFARSVVSSGGRGERLRALDYLADGSPFQENVSSVWRSAASAATWLLPGEDRVVDASGGVYDSADLAWLDNLEGPIRDVVPLADGFLALHEGRLAAYDSELRVVAGLDLSVDGDALALYEGSVFVFQGAQIPLRIALDELVPGAPGPSIEPEGLAFTPTSLALDENGVLYLLSPPHRSIFRWSVQEARYLDSLRLAPDALQMAYSAAHRRLYVTHPWGIHQISLDASAVEVPWLDLPDPPAGVAAAGELVVVSAGDWPTARLLALDAEGGLSSEIEFLIPAPWLSFNEPSRRIFLGMSFLGAGNLSQVTLDATGTLGPPVPSVSLGSGPAPLFVYPDGSRVIARNGKVYDGATLALVGDLKRSPVGVAFLEDDTLVVLSSSGGLELFGSDLGRLLSRQLGARWLLPFGIDLVAVFEEADGTIRAELVAAGDLDGDGVAGTADRFPGDPLEWSDRDGDGAGDNGDVFPEDPHEAADSDGDGVGDNADAFPHDPFEWQDGDSDGVGDNQDEFPSDPREWRDSDGDGVGDSADPFPNDASEWLDSDRDGVGDNQDELPFDPSENRDFDRDGIGDRWDPFPAGEPFVALAGLTGTQRLSFRGLGALKAPLDGNLGLLADGSFTLCEAGACMVGVHRARGSKGRKFELSPDPRWLAEIEKSLEETARFALSEAFERALRVNFVLRPKASHLRVKLNRDGDRGRVRLRLRFRAEVSGVPRRFRTIRVTYSWKPPAVDLAGP